MDKLWASEATIFYTGDWNTWIRGFERRDTSDLLRDSAALIVDELSNVCQRFVLFLVSRIVASWSNKTTIFRRRSRTNHDDTYINVNNFTNVVPCSYTFSGYVDKLEKWNISVKQRSALPQTSQLDTLPYQRRTIRRVVFLIFNISIHFTFFFD